MRSTQHLRSATDSACSDDRGCTARFELARAGFFNVRFGSALLLTGFAYVFGLLMALRNADGSSTTALHIAFVGLIAVLSLLNAKRSSFHQIRIAADSISYPQNTLFGTRPTTVPLTSVVSIERGLRKGAENLKIGLRGRFPVTLSAKRLTFGSVEQVAQCLRAAIDSSPAADEIAARVRFADTIRARQSRLPFVATGLSVVFVVVFAVGTNWPDGSERLVNAVALGGFNQSLFRAGDLHRAFCAAFIHADASHLIANCALLMAVGYRIEHIVGSRTLLLVFLIGALTGYLVSAGLGRFSVSVGASGGLFSLFATYGAILFRYRERLPTTVQFAPNWWLACMAPLLFLPLPGLNHAAHVTGALAGASLSPWFARVNGACSRNRRAAAHIVFAAFLLALSAGAYEAVHWQERKRDIPQVILDDATAHGADVNLAAWLLVRDAAAEGSALRAALTTLRRIEGKAASERHTEGVLAMHLGDYAAAIESLRAAAVMQPSEEHLADLMKAELRHLAERCVPYTDRPVPPPIAFEAGLAGAAEIHVFVDHGARSEFVIASGERAVAEYATRLAGSATRVSAVFTSRTDAFQQPLLVRANNFGFPPPSGDCTPGEGGRAFSVSKPVTPVSGHEHGPRRWRRTVFDKSLQRLEAGDAGVGTRTRSAADGGEPCLIRAFSVSKPATPRVGTRTRSAPMAASRVR